MIMNTSFIHPHSSTTTKTGTKTGTKIGMKPGNDPTTIPPHQQQHLDQMPVDRSTQQAVHPRNSLANTHTTASHPVANLNKQVHTSDATSTSVRNTTNNLIKIMFVLIGFLFLLFFSDMFITNRVHREIARLNWDPVKNNGMKTTTNVVMNDKILVAGASSNVKFKPLRVTESSTEQKLTTFDWSKYLETKTVAVDGDRKQSTEVAGAEAVSGDLYLIF